MLPPGYGPLIIEGSVPDSGPLRRQKFRIEANGAHLGEFDVARGDFQLIVKVPPELDGRLLQLKIKASGRRPAYRLKSIRWAQPQKPAGSRALPTYAGQ
jgi:hypothetical protein